MWGNKELLLFYPVSWDENAMNVTEDDPRPVVHVELSIMFAPE